MLYSCERFIAMASMGATCEAELLGVNDDEEGGCTVTGQTTGGIMMFDWQACKGYFYAPHTHTHTHTHTHIQTSTQSYAHTHTHTLAASPLWATSLTHTGGGVS